MNCTPYIFVMSLFTTLILPHQLFAQTTNLKTPNKNQSARFKSAIFKGSGNLVQSNTVAAFIGGGLSNTIAVESHYAVVGVGRVNRTSGESATIGGGYNNNALTEGATVGGGRNNDATGLTATVSGGDNNIAGGETSAVAGGSDNNAIGDQSFIGTGNNNDSFGSFAVIERLPKGSAFQLGDELTQNRPVHHRTARPIPPALEQSTNTSGHKLTAVAEHRLT